MYMQHEERRAEPDEEYLIVSTTSLIGPWMIVLHDVEKINDRE